MTYKICIVSADPIDIDSLRQRGIRLEHFRGWIDNATWTDDRGDIVYCLTSRHSNKAQTETLYLYRLKYPINDFHYFMIVKLEEQALELLFGRSVDNVFILNEEIGDN